MADSDIAVTASVIAAIRATPFSPCYCSKSITNAATGSCTHLSSTLRLQHDPFLKSTLPTAVDVPSAISALFDSELLSLY